MRVSFRAKPAAALLKNRFNSGGFKVAVGKVQMQCSPAQQTARSVGAHRHELDHPRQCPSGVLGDRPEVADPSGVAGPQNQFGTGVLRPTAARSLCLPSWKNSTSGPKFPATAAPTNLDSYACYSAVHVAGKSAFAPAQDRCC